MNIDAKLLHKMSSVVRATGLKMIRNAHSGHVGIVLGAADIITAIYVLGLKRGVDRFVMSAGHGSALLYSVLKLSGYDIGDLSGFRKIDGLPGHPEFGLDGVDATTGPLGQGIGNAIGMALAAKHKKNGGRVFCLCSDGDLMEGVAQESIAFAGRYKLDNLVVCWDNNGISIDGIAQTDKNVAERMRAAGWTVFVANGHNFSELNRALLKKSVGPLFIQCNTTIGLFSSVVGQPLAHGLALSDTEMEKLIEQLDSDVGRALWQKFAHENIGNDIQSNENIIPKISLPTVKQDYISTRELSGIYLSNLFGTGLDLIGGSADLSASTNVKTKKSKVITANDFSGNFINYGVREHAMAAIMNGIAYSGLRVYGSTFLVFSDYMRGSMRLAALAGLPVIYVLTHDSIAVGEDGPTHQPIEQISGLRLIPNMNVFRPCNMTEVANAWQTALRETSKPSCIILSRQKIEQVHRKSQQIVDCGAYIIKPAKKRVKITLIATGSEVPLAISVAKKLGDNVQVVSMPSVSHFRNQDLNYRRNVLRGYVVAIEAGVTAPWFEFADAVIGIDDFGVSGNGNDVYNECGFNANVIAEAILQKIK